MAKEILDYMEAYDAHGDVFYTFKTLNFYYKDFKLYKIEIGNLQPKYLGCDINILYHTINKLFKLKVFS